MSSSHHHHHATIIPLETTEDTLEDCKGAIANQDQAEAAAGLRINMTENSAMAEDQLRSTLYTMRDCSTAEGAYESMVVLDQLLDSDVDMVVRKRTAERISRLNGVTTILVALAHWHVHSSDFSGVAMHCLVNMTYLTPKTVPLIIHTGLRTIVLAAQHYPQDYAVSSNTVGLLHNCSEYDTEIRLQVSTEECLHIIVNSMSKWLGSSYHQERGCLYLFEMSRIEEAKSKLLREKRVCSLLAKALDHFRNEDNAVYRAAQRTLMVYAPG
jgi:hypothetical protein